MSIYQLIPLTIVLSLITFSSCDHGLAPPSENVNNMSGITGIITYENWPADSLYDLRLVIFKSYPPDNIIEDVFNGRAIVYPGLGDPGLPTYIDTTGFLVELNSGTYEYVVVAQQYGENPSTDWRAVGQYDTLAGDDLPTAITVYAGRLLEEINIHVDFNHLPLQPF